MGTGCLTSRSEGAVLSLRGLSGSEADHDLALGPEYNISGDQSYTYRNFTTTIAGADWHGMLDYCSSGICVGNPIGVPGFNSLQYYRTGAETTESELMFPVPA